MLNVILFWTERGPGQYADVVVLEQVLRDLSSVWVGTVLLQNGVSMATNGTIWMCKHLVNRPLLNGVER